MNLSGGLGRLLMGFLAVVTNSYRCCYQGVKNKTTLKDKNKNNKIFVSIDPK